MNDKKILILDIDGTLVNSEKKVTKATKDALIKVQEEGHIVALASGRPAPGMSYPNELELDRFGGYILSFNGGKIINCKTKEVVYQRVLPKDIIEDMYEFAVKNDCGLITYEGEEIIVGTRMDEYIEYEAKLNKIPTKQVENFLEYLTFDVNKCLMTADGDRAKEYTEFLSEKYGDRISVYRSEPFFIEIMPKNVDKAASIDLMAELLELNKENIICCGDGHNDLTMIQYAPLGVAMANAVSEVKEVADFITTKSNDEDGLVEVVEQFIL